MENSYENSEDEYDEEEEIGSYDINDSDNEDLNKNKPSL